MMLDEGQRVISMLVADSESYCVLTATENGFGKRTSIAEYTRHGRGSKGMNADGTGKRLLTDSLWEDSMPLYLPAK